jgi:hypothetical protein
MNCTRHNVERHRNYKSWIRRWLGRKWSEIFKHIPGEIDVLNSENLVRATSQGPPRQAVKSTTTLVDRYTLVSYLASLQEALTSVRIEFSRFTNTHGRETPFCC